MKRQKSLVSKEIPKEETRYALMHLLLVVMIYEIKMIIR